jgi:hypothetical protein
MDGHTLLVTAVHTEVQQMQHCTGCNLHQAAVMCHMLEPAESLSVTEWSLTVTECAPVVCCAVLCCAVSQGFITDTAANIKGFSIEPRWKEELLRSTTARPGRT